MQSFAGKVAEGRLDEPLEMDRNNLFGAFSESFDIMREELSAVSKVYSTAAVMQLVDKGLVELDTPVV